MPIEFYSSVMLLIVLLLTAMISYLQTCNAISGIQRRCFLWGFLVMIISIAAQVAGELVKGFGVAKIIYIIITLVELCSSPLVAVFFSAACEYRTVANIAGVITGLHVIVEIVMSFFGLIFYIDDANVYVRGPLHFIYVATYALSTLVMIHCFVRAAKRFKNKNIFTLVLAVLVGVTGAALNTFFANIQTGLMGAALAIVIFFAYFEGLLEQEVYQKNEENSKRIQKMQSGIIAGMANLIESRDGYTGEHVKNTAKYVYLLASMAKDEGLYPDVLTDEYVTRISKAAMLHDVGKIVVSDTVLNKPGKLSDEEFAAMKLHAAEGGDIVKSILAGVTDMDFAKDAEDIARYHHEKWNGTGYPEGKKDEDIPLSARLMAIADVYDALVARRVYKAPMPKEKALAIIEEGAGTHFDEKLARLFVKMMREDTDDLF